MWLFIIFLNEHLVEAVFQSDETVNNKFNRVKGHGKIYMQIMSLKNNFITRIIGYREEQTWNRPAGLQRFQKETPIQVFFYGICETFKNSGGCFWKHVTYCYITKNYTGHTFYSIAYILTDETWNSSMMWRDFERIEQTADTRAWNRKKYCSCCIMLIIDTILSKNIWNNFQNFPFKKLFTQSGNQTHILEVFFCLLTHFGCPKLSGDC